MEVSKLILYLYHEKWTLEMKVKEFYWFAAAANLEVAMKFLVLLRCVHNT
jgi:hypothetical protein